MAKEERMIDLICTGCGIPFKKRYSVYKAKAAWGAKEFWHSARCAVDSRSKRAGSNNSY